MIDDSNATPPPTGITRFLPPRIRAAWRIAMRVAVILFVLWHLSFLFITNAKLEAPAVDAAGVNHWPGQCAAWWVDAARNYQSYAYLDQSWGMFASPLWRHCPFPAGRVELSDGSKVDLLSVNEPPDKTSFFRFGGARQRKLEHHLVSYDLRRTYQEPMQRRYARTYADRWREQNPDDPRRVVSVTILSRDFTAPNPGVRWEASPPVKPTEFLRYEMEDEASE